MATTTHLGITLVEQSQAQKEVTVNAAFTRLDAFLNNGAKSRSTSTPPGSPASGDLYIVGSSPTGAWAGQAGMLVYFDQIWKFITPIQGMTLWVNDVGALYTYGGSSWGLTASPAVPAGNYRYNNSGALTGVVGSAVDNNGYIFPRLIVFSLPGAHYRHRPCQLDDHDQCR